MEYSNYLKMLTQKVSGNMKYMNYINPPRFSCERFQNVYTNIVCMDFMGPEMQEGSYVN